ncbi:bifunctional 2-polyprenyl-6-hydroxyphenol methylase/3-demethylubiquinol 3-O-methyltransferase UbiG [Endozoicomonas sp. OPT23]|uniref:class I SAM-dependent methyltransferase n=1 Tax=Endozoicomonas sp. OPT23 TaxID=2072845 RepID=UPI00129B1CA3|nr:class I SAM-dependent methyltransferase [Endozoicomonas sp. OPT23]
MSLYDARVASAYKTGVSLLPWRRWAEPWTYHQVLGDIAGKDILDAACGVGVVSLMMADLGAGSVTGVDISSAMIDRAKLDSTAPVINYINCDFSDYQAASPHDIAVSSFIVNEAETVEQLGLFVRAFHRNLKVKGKLALVLDIPDRLQGVDHSSYGYRFSLPEGRMKDEDRFKLYIDVDKSLVELELSYFSYSTIRNILEENGFQEVAFTPLMVPEEAHRAMPSDYWDMMICRPGLFVVSAIKMSKSQL